MKKLCFTKMHGAGNDFIVIEDLNNMHEDLSNLAKKLCHRNFGIGADGILVVKNSDKAQVQMIIINADGSVASMCGNGLRCFVKYVFDNGIVKGNEVTVETGDGIKTCYINEDDEKAISITVNMGEYTFEPTLIPANTNEPIIQKNIVANNEEYIISTLLLGVPHTIILGKLDSFSVIEGEAIEHHELFPKGTNVNFCEVKSKDEICVKTWERGVGATMACGTGSCASVVVCNKLNLVNSNVKVSVPGGCLEVEVDSNVVYMTGDAQITFKGEIEL